MLFAEVNDIKNRVCCVDREHHHPMYDAWTIKSPIVAQLYWDKTTTGYWVRVTIEEEVEWSSGVTTSFEYHRSADTVHWSPDVDRMDLLKAQVADTLVLVDEAQLNT